MLKIFFEKMLQKNLTFSKFLRKKFFRYIKISMVMYIKVIFVT